MEKETKDWLQDLGGSVIGPRNKEDWSSHSKMPILPQASKNALDLTQKPEIICWVEVSWELLKQVSIEYSKKHPWLNNFKNINNLAMDIIYNQIISNIFCMILAYKS